MQRKVFRVKGIVRRDDMRNVLACFNDVSLERTPNVRITQRFQDRKSDKQKISGKKSRNRKGYGKTLFVEFKSTNQNDMIALHEVVAAYFQPGTDSSRL